MEWDGKSMQKIKGSAAFFCWVCVDHWLGCKELEECAPQLARHILHFLMSHGCFNEGPDRENQQDRGNIDAHGPKCNILQAAWCGGIHGSGCILSSPFLWRIRRNALSRWRGTRSLCRGRWVSPWPLAGSSPGCRTRLRGPWYCLPSFVSPCLLDRAFGFCLFDDAASEKYRSL